MNIVYYYSHLLLQKQHQLFTLVFLIYIYCLNNTIYCQEEEIQHVNPNTYFGSYLFFAFITLYLLNVYLVYNNSTYIDFDNLDINIAEAKLTQNNLNLHNEFLEFDKRNNNLLNQMDKPIKESTNSFFYAEGKN